MKSLRSRLPPPNALVVFEAVARLLSFTAAARELGVSQAAASRQVQNLEAHLGLALFRRERKRVSLTGPGEQLRRAVEAGLNQIADAAEALRPAGRPDRLTVATTIAFSAFWLMPRLFGFHAAHPVWELNLITSDAERDWAAEGVSVSVVFGAGEAPGYRVEPLFGEQVLAVAHPDHFAGRPIPERPEALLGETLLQMDSDQVSWSSWPDWLRRCGVAASERLPGPRFNNYTIAIQAALDGGGIALGWRRLVEPLLRAGRLVPVTEARVVPAETYRMLSPEAGPTSPWANPRAAAFRGWLAAEAAKDWA